MAQVNKQVRLAARPSGPATAELARWLGEGRLIAREHIVHGSVTDFPEVLLMLFAGENTGKLIPATGTG